MTAANQVLVEMHAAHKARRARMAGMAVPEHKPEPMQMAEAVEATAVAEAVRMARMPRKPSVKLVLEVCADLFGYSVQEICSSSRLRTIIPVRHVAVFLSRELTALSYEEIGRRIGDRDHHTIMWACRKIAAIVEGEKSLRVSPGARSCSASYVALTNKAISNEDLLVKLNEARAIILSRVSGGGAS